jgi:hypothetical protein
MLFLFILLIGIASQGMIWLTQLEEISFVLHVVYISLSGDDSSRIHLGIVSSLCYQRTFHPY